LKIPADFQLFIEQNILQTTTLTQYPKDKKFVLLVEADSVKLIEVLELNQLQLF
jgi:hypothetical protein